MFDMIPVLLYQVGIFPNTSRRWKRSPKKVSVWDTLDSDSDYTASGEEEEGGEDEEEEEGKEGEEKGEEGEVGGESCYASVVRTSVLASFPGLPSFYPLTL